MLRPMAIHGTTSGDMKNESAALAQLLLLRASASAASVPRIADMAVAQMATLALRHAIDWRSYDVSSSAYHRNE